MKYSASRALGDRGPPETPGLMGFRADAVIGQIQVPQSGVLLKRLGQGLTRRQMTAESSRAQNIKIFKTKFHAAKPDLTKGDS